MRVDVGEVLRSKNPKLAKRIPRFVINYVKRVIHQDDINEILELYGDLHGIDFVRATLAHMNISYAASGLDKIDPTKRYVFASNHPFGGMDGMMLADEVIRHAGETRVVVNDILMYLTPIAELFVPVNKHGRQRGSNVDAFNDAFSSDMQMITFPAGLCSRRKKGVVSDLAWRPNFVKKAAQSGRDIVPVYFEGELSNFFYRLSNFRTFLGIKANIEMLYLPREMFRQRGKNFTIHFGEPISTTELLEGRNPREATQVVRDAVYAMQPKK